MKNNPFGAHIGRMKPALTVHVPKVSFKELFETPVVLSVDYSIKEDEIKKAMSRAEPIAHLVTPPDAIIMRANGNLYNERQSPIGSVWDPNNKWINLAE